MYDDSLIRARVIPGRTGLTCEAPPRG